MSGGLFRTTCGTPSLPAWANPAVMCGRLPKSLDTATFPLVPVTFTRQKRQWKKPFPLWVGTELGTVKKQAEITMEVKSL
jgi:hypothetical protein